jgi:hypothetical protein
MEHDSSGHDPRMDDIPVAGLTYDEVRARSELARHLRGSLFPADRTTLIQFAVEEQLPADVTDALRRLPPGRYLNVEGVWEALGGRREERLPNRAEPAAVDPDAAAQPRVAPPSDEDVGHGPATGGSPTDRFAFRFDLVHRLAGVPFLVSPGSAEVLVDRTGGRPALRIHFGPWRVETPVANVESTAVTGPYHVLKTVGPAHVSLADRGLTFATNDARGLCIRFHEPVRGVEPLGVLRHPSVTVTVADVDGLRTALRAS